MTSQNLPRLQQELQTFLEEYLSLQKQESTLIRFDFFYEETKGTRLPDRWHLSILAAREGKQCLIGSQGELLGQYDRITPLFCLPRNQKLEATISDIQDQLLCLRSKAKEEDVLTLTHSLHTLCAPFRSVSAAYLVEEQGLFGIMDPLGHTLVPAKYRKIEPFPFREKFGVQGNCPVPGGLYGETGLYLCRGDLHRLNSTDVYDLQGNLIFKEIADLYPREEIWVTPVRNCESLGALLTKEKRVRSLWVSRREAAHPFPEAPELQSILDQSEHYSVRSLMQEPNAPSMVWDVDGSLADRAIQKSPQIFRELLQPFAASVACHIGTAPEEVLARLRDYRDFYRQRTQLQIEKLRPEMPLTALGLTAQAFNCLVRNGVTNLGELLELPANRLSNLWRSTPEATEEITKLHAMLQEYFGSPEK